MDINQLFAKNVKQLRLAQSISQEELAEKADIHRTYVSQVERGINNPTLASANAIAVALGRTLSEMLDEKKTFD